MPTHSQNVLLPGTLPGSTSLVNETSISDSAVRIPDQSGDIVNSSTSEIIYSRSRPQVAGHEYPHPGRSVLILAVTCLLGCGAQETDVAEESVQYNRDVRPILSDKCFHCHGPDAAARQADLRLDRREEALAERNGRQVIVPGEPSNSELIRRILSTNDDERMPPPDSGVSLSPEEIGILRRWIQNDAEYQAHWSFISPKRPPLPDVADRTWPKNAIDHFVLAELERHGLKPSPAADAAMLIRRLSLDLTGLPPAIEEVDLFEQDASQNPDAACSLLVDRLLKSPRYGEHMAVGWLDVARYADTNGYFTDNDRTMWPWRDWVIGAFNQNMPFDQFTIEQLAGDLLPGSTIDQKIATGFNRNHMVNNETGIIEEEFRVEYVVDRADTTATVWMGLTLGCARCHDHKYDPISQQDFYRFFAFFNNVPERGLSGSGGNSTPILKVPAENLQAQLEQVRRRVMAAEQKFAAVQKELETAQSAWEATALGNLPSTDLSGLVAHYPLDNGLPPAHSIGSVSVSEGMVGNAAKFGGDGHISISDSPDFDRNNAFSIAMWIYPESEGCLVSKMDDAREMRGFDVTLRKGQAIVNLVHGWNRNAIQVTTTASVPTRQWQHLMVTYDGSSKASGVAVYLDGQVQPVNIAQNNLTETIRNTEPLRIGRRQASASLNGLIDDVRLYDRPLSSNEVASLASSQLVLGILSKPVEKRSEPLQRKLRAWFVSHHADVAIAEASTELERLRKEAAELARSIPSTMVMEDSAKRRPTFVLVRGEYDQPGDEVMAGMLKFPSNDEFSVGFNWAALNRLDLAKWLVDPEHPLTARVTVNRLWQQFFGTGLVKTADDFGTQGDWPSHPELLDWLAVELVESGWDIQHILKLIVTSATYQQSSNASPPAYASDPENRLLARGPRSRMPAEMLRDNALAISGLLVEKVGGPSVKPYQPAGLWEAVTYDGDSEYVQDSGESLYRRSLYTFWKRQSPPPAMLTFDAPTRETCTAQRSLTSTPLQALVLMNDPTFIESARRLAERMMILPDKNAAARVEFAFRSATARRPTPEEVRILLDVFEAQQVAYAKTPNNAASLLAVGESQHDTSLDATHLAAWTTVASMILTLDETITKR